MGFNIGDKVRLTVKHFASERAYEGAEGVVDGYNPTSQWPYSVVFGDYVLPYVGEDEIKLIEDEKKSQFNVGDRVELVHVWAKDIMHGVRGTVIEQVYDEYPVAVKFDNGQTYRCLYEDEVRLTSGPRKDWTELVDRVNEYLEAAKITAPHGVFSGPTMMIQELRDALVEESYRD